MAWYDANNAFFLNLAEVNNVVARLEQKLTRGLAFEGELSFLVENVPGNFIAHRLLSDLQSAQSERIESAQALYDRFGVLEGALRETAMTPRSTQSLWGNAFAKMASALLLREEVHRKGEGVHQRISRAGCSLRMGDLESALAELNHLDEDVLFPAQSWLDSARRRVLGLSALRMLKSEMLSRSIKMVDNE